MLAVGEKRTWRPPLFHHVTHTQHGPPHFPWPPVQTIPPKIVCDCFSRWNKTLSRSAQDNWRPDEGRTGVEHRGEGGVVREGITEN